MNAVDRTIAKEKATYLFESSWKKPCLDKEIRKII